MTAEAVRGVQRLRSGNAGVVLDAAHAGRRTAAAARAAARGRRLPDGVRPGSPPGTGSDFAEAWGTEWVETRDVTDRQIFADQPLDQGAALLRRLVTGKAADRARR